MAERSRHCHNHIVCADENFQYRGDVARKLCESFIQTEQPEYRVLLLQGFTTCGKTRTSKEYARMVANELRGRGKKEVHTFYFDLQRYKTKDELLDVILRDLSLHIPGWEKYCKAAHIDDICLGFKLCQNGSERTYVIVLDNIDSVGVQAERAKVLEFIRDVISLTENVHLVVTSRTSVRFVRIRDFVKEHHMEGMSVESAKELLREASGNPEGLEEYEDRIIGLVHRSPLALIIAGHEMNEKRSQMPYEPKEFVEVMEDSACLTLGLENVPEGDRLCDRVKEIIDENYEVLEKVTFALEDPALFEPKELYTLINMSSGHIKQSFLLILLNGSLYSAIQDKATGRTQLLQSAPFLLKVLDEAFCYICQKDCFVKEINSALVKALDERKDLVTSKAGEIREAEKHLLSHQKKGDCSAEEVRDLRRNVIGRATELVKDVIENVRERNTLSQRFSDVLKMVEEQESLEETSICTQHNGIQETCDRKRTVPVSSDSSSSRRSNGKEPEACLSPTCPSFLDDIPECSPELTNKKSTAQPAVSESKGTVPKQSHEEDKRTIEGAEEDNIGADKIVSDIKDIKGSPTNDGGQKPFQTLSSTVDTNSRDNILPDSDGLAFATSASSDSVTSNEIDDLAQKLLEAACTSSYGSLNSSDLRRPVQEHQHSAPTSFSNLSTTPDHHNLTSQFATNSGSNSGDNDDLPNRCSRKEAVESEVDWQESESVHSIDTDELPDPPEKVKIHTSNKISDKEITTGHSRGCSSNIAHNPNLTIEIPRGSVEPNGSNQVHFHQPGQHPGTVYPGRGQESPRPSPTMPYNAYHSQVAHSPQWSAPRQRGANAQSHMGYDQQNLTSHASPVRPHSPRNNFYQQMPGEHIYRSSHPSRGRHLSGNTPVQYPSGPGVPFQGPPSPFPSSNISSPSPSFQPRGPPTSIRYQHSHPGNSPQIPSGDWGSPNIHQSRHALPPTPSHPSMKPPTNGTSSIQPLQTRGFCFDASGQPMNSHVGHHQLHNRHHQTQNGHQQTHNGDQQTHNGHHQTHVRHQQTHIGHHQLHNGHHQTHNGHHQTQNGQHQTHNGQHQTHNGHHQTHNGGANTQNRYDAQHGPNLQHGGQRARGPPQVGYYDHGYYHGNQGYR